MQMSLLHLWNTNWNPTMSTIQSSTEDINMIIQIAILTILGLLAAIAKSESDYANRR